MLIGLYMIQFDLNHLIDSTLVDKEYEILQGKRRFLADPCSWVHSACKDLQGSARNFRFPCKILHSSTSKFYCLDSQNLVAPCKRMYSKTPFLVDSLTGKGISQTSKNSTYAQPTPLAHLDLSLKYPMLILKTQ